jgi:hypothetical protein
MTSAWFTKNLGDAMLAGEALVQLEACFQSTYPSGHSDKIAIFIRHESEGHLHCEVKAYFPPDAVDLAKKVDADPCAKPSPDGLSLLVGDGNSWRSLFPEFGAKDSLL